MKVVYKSNLMAKLIAESLEGRIAKILMRLLVGTVIPSFDFKKLHVGIPFRINNCIPVNYLLYYNYYPSFCLISFLHHNGGITSFWLNGTVVKTLLNWF